MTIPLLVWPQWWESYLYFHVYSCSDVEPTQTPINWWQTKENVVHMGDEVLFSHEKSETVFRWKPLCFVKSSSPKRTNIMYFSKSVIINTASTINVVQSQDWKFGIWLLFAAFSILLRNSRFFFSTHYVIIPLANGVWSLWWWSEMKICIRRIKRR